MAFQQLAIPLQKTLRNLNLSDPKLTPAIGRSHHLEVSENNQKTRTKLLGKITQ